MRIDVASDASLSSLTGLKHISLVSKLSGIKFSLLLLKYVLSLTHHDIHFVALSYTKTSSLLLTLSKMSSVYISGLLSLLAV